MPKKILLIENDTALAGRVSRSLEASGFDVRTTGDGKEGLDLARDWTPAAIVLCVELPSMSGYLVCQKLKKDDALRSIPLVLTSAEATEETFEKHKTLKARADEYLLKPYEPGAVVEKLGALIGLPERADPTEIVPDAEEELVDLEAEVGLEAAEGEPDAEVPGLTLESLPDEAATADPAPGVDEELRLLDDAFDGLAAPPGEHDAGSLDDLTGEKRMAVDEVDAAAASLPEDGARAGRRDLGGLEDEADAALGALGSLDEALSPGVAVDIDEPEPPTRPLRGASAELLRAAGIKLLEDDADGATAPPSIGADRAAGDGRDAEVRDLRRKLEALTRRADQTDAELAQSKGRAEAAQERTRKAEAEAKAAREEARRAGEAELSELRRKAAEAERRAADAEKRAAAAEQEGRRKAEATAGAADAIARAEALEREADDLRTELLVARGEADGARGEVERRTGDLRKRVAELETANAKNEERVVKAYQKIKADEKIRDKVRKALAIAIQLLEEGVPAEPAAEKDRRAARE